MKILTLCKNCKKYYVFYADDGEILAEGCKLDIPLFKKNRPINCSSYADK